MPRHPRINPPSGLRPDHLAADAPANSLVPLYLQPRFLAIPSLLALAFAGGWLRLRRRAADPNYEASARDRALSKAANRVLVQLDEAARAGDTAQFFNSARSALQRMLAARWQMAAGQITTADVAARLGGESDGEDIRQLFALADEANYSGHEPTTIDFARWTQVVRRGMLGGARVMTGRTPLTALHHRPDPAGVPSAGAIGAGRLFRRRSVQRSQRLRPRRQAGHGRSQL